MKQPNIYEFQTLPSSAQVLPEDLDIPTIVLEGEEAFPNFTARFNLEIPDEIVDPVPLGIVHGWFGTQSSYVPLREWCARNGKPAFTIEPSRKLANFAGYHPKHLFHPDRLLAQTAWGAIRGLQRMRAAEKAGVDVSQVDLFTHSMGGRSGADAAIVKPEHAERIRTITFNAAAGLEPHSVPAFVKSRIPNFVKGELVPAYTDGHLKAYTSRAAAGEFVKYVIDGGARTLKEGLSIGSCNIRDKAERLGELGVKSAMVVYLADAMIPAYPSLQHSGDIMNLAALFPYEEAGHLAPQIYPEAVGKGQFELLEALLGKKHPRLTPVAHLGKSAIRLDEAA